LSTAAKSSKEIAAPRLPFISSFPTPLLFFLYTLVYNLIQIHSSWSDSVLSSLPPARVSFLRSYKLSLVNRFAGSMQEQLPQNLLQHIKKFEEVFTVDTAKLKEIVKHFVKELEKGMFPVPQPTHSVSRS
jgi:hypothetical protein